MNKKYKLVASLRYGEYQEVIFIISIILSVLGVTAVPFGIYECRTEIVEVVALSILLCIILAIALVIICHCAKVKREYNKCLEDGVILDATTEITDKVSGPQVSEVIHPTARIKVHFYYNGKKITKRSGVENYKQIYDGTRQAGYDKVFFRYGNREIKILYSEKYDHVFIIKPKQKKE